MVPSGTTNHGFCVPPAMSAAPCAYDTFAQLGSVGVGAALRFTVGSPLTIVTLPLRIDGSVEEVVVVLESIVARVTPEPRPARS